VVVGERRTEQRRRAKEGVQQKSGPAMMRCQTTRMIFLVKFHRSYALAYFFLLTRRSLTLSSGHVVSWVQRHLPNSTGPMTQARPSMRLVKVVELGFRQRWLLYERQSTKKKYKEEEHYDDDDDDDKCAANPNRTTNGGRKRWGNEAKERNHPSTMLGE
jgi:hypothetical protein